MIYGKQIRIGNSFGRSFGRSFARTRGTATIRIPRQFPNTGAMQFEVRSVAELRTYTMEVEDNGGRLYHVFEVAPPLGMPAGEYNYTLRQGGEILARGIMILRGEDHIDTIEFSEKKSYIQYE